MIADPIPVAVTAPDPAGGMVVGLAGASNWLVNGVVALVALGVAGWLYTVTRKK